MPRVVCGYCSIIERANALPAADADDCLHGICDVLLDQCFGDAPRLLLCNHLVVVLKQSRAQRFGGVAHVNGPREPALLREVHQGADVVQVEVRHEDAVDTGVCAEAAEVGEPPVVEVSRVHAHI